MVGSIVRVVNLDDTRSPTSFDRRESRVNCEVKGPPNQPNNTNETGALDHANSACAASGLNDFDPAEGQNASQVQTAADSWKYYGLPKGAPGKLGLCRGGTGERP
jgi:hypothetical protein